MRNNIEAARIELQILISALEPLAEMVDHQLPVSAYKLTCQVELGNPWVNVRHTFTASPLTSVR